jgi:hypothetical protein
MTTTEMIFELRQFARTPDTDLGRFLSDVAFRLERLEKLKDHFLAAEQAIKYDPACHSEPELS